MKKTSTMYCFWKLKRKKKSNFRCHSCNKHPLQKPYSFANGEKIRTNVVNVDLTAVSKSVIKRFGENINFLSCADDCKSLNNN
jgi:hypothetical protein